MDWAYVSGIYISLTFGNWSSLGIHESALPKQKILYFQIQNDFIVCNVQFSWLKLLAWALVGFKNERVLCDISEFRINIDAINGWI